MRKHFELQEGGVFSQKYASEQPFIVSVFSGHSFLSVSIENWRPMFSRPGPGSPGRKQLKCNSNIALLLPEGPTQTGHGDKAQVHFE